MDDISEQYYVRLKNMVEENFGKKLFSHNEFCDLSIDIYEKTLVMISHTTLKRFWGYLKHEQHYPQVRTLNVLSLYCGFENWDCFCKYQDSTDSYASEFVTRNTLHSYLIEPGRRIVLKWYPNRKIVLEHIGNGDMFKVAETVNSKLKAGMTLQCETFTAGQMLCLRNITGEGITTPCDYICGKVNGVEFFMMEES